MNEVNTAPVAQLKTNRGLLKLFLLSLITFGIYPLFFYNSIANDVNVICSRYDGKKTMNYWLLVLIVTPPHLRYRCHCLVPQDLQPYRC